MCSRVITITIAILFIISSIGTSTAIGASSPPSQNVTSGSVSKIEPTANTVQGESSTAHTKYVIKHDSSTNSSLVNLEVTVKEPSKYSNWKITWDIPQDAKITRAETKYSETVSTKRNGNSVTFIEKDGPPRKTATFYISYKTSSILTVKDTPTGIPQYEVTLSAIKNQPSTLKITFEDTPIANAVRYTPHSIQVDQNVITAKGTGPIALIINLKPEDYTLETKHFVVYNNDISKKTLTNAYAISTTATGVIPQYNKVPIVVLSAEKYDSQISSSSDGQFSSGIIYLSKDKINKNSLLPLLTHEYTHAITQRLEETSPPRWFTEGVSQYTEAIAKKKLGQPQNQIDTERLWNYHKEDKNWVTTQWTQDTSKIREFAYDYSELLFKYQSQTQSPAYIQKLYKQLLSDDLTITQSTTGSLLFGDWDGTVCAGNTKEEVTQCGTKTMEYEPPLNQPESYSTPFNRTATHDISFTDPKQKPQTQPSNPSIINTLLDVLTKIIRQFI